MQVSSLSGTTVGSTVSQRDLRVLLVYPNTRDVAMANLGFQQVYSLLNQVEGVMCDRFAMPIGWKPEVQSLKKEELCSMESKIHPLEFDVIAFSISFEPDYLNAVLALKYFGIPLDRAERDESYPMIAAGGSAIFINPEPLAECMDVLFIGEGEGLAERFFTLLCKNEDRNQFFKQAVLIPGVYLPERYRPEIEQNLQVGISPIEDAPQRVMRHWVMQEQSLCTHSVLHDEDSTFKDMALMEVTRGCIWACRFCTAGFIYRPPRLPDLEKTYNEMENLLNNIGKSAQTVGLVGPSVTDHPELTNLARKITGQGKKLSFSSLRMETLTDELVDLILQSGQKTLTVAVDGPSERMRDVINKSATDDFIVEKCRFLTRKGVLHLKIYSIIGLPLETDEDIDQFIRLVERVQEGYVEECSKLGRIGRLTIGLSPLVPKPGTPFQWHPMESVKSLKKKFARVRKALSKLPHLKMSFGSPNEAYLQTYLSRGDRSTQAFFKTYQNNGHDAKKALKEHCVDQYVYRQYEKDDYLPWDIVDHGYREDFLWEDYQRGLQAAHTPVCDTAICHICGLC
ncbi:MAG: radical SAM protein [Nitrospinae bacterium]|nr:radical SAM protein [Nitrospinota bacterium]MZH45484.1 radical SAM protein [Nitrospinota bacterium]